MLTATYISRKNSSSQNSALAVGWATVISGYSSIRVLHVSIRSVFYHDQLKIKVRLSVSCALSSILHHFTYKVPFLWVSSWNLSCARFGMTSQIPQWNGPEREKGRKQSVMGENDTSNRLILFSSKYGTEFDTLGMLSPIAYFSTM